MMEKTLSEMIERLEKDEEATYEDVVEEFLDNIGFEELLGLARELKDEKDFADELKDILFAYLLGKLEDRFEEEA